MLWPHRRNTHERRPGTKEAKYKSDQILNTTNQIPTTWRSHWTTRSYRSHSRRTQTQPRWWRTHTKTHMASTRHTAYDVGVYIHIYTYIYPIAPPSSGGDQISIMWRNVCFPSEASDKDGGVCKGQRSTDEQVTSDPHSTHRITDVYDGQWTQHQPDNNNNKDDYIHTDKRESHERTGTSMFNVSSSSSSCVLCMSVCVCALFQNFTTRCQSISLVYRGDVTSPAVAGLHPSTYYVPSIIPQIWRSCARS